MRQRSVNTALLRTSAVSVGLVNFIDFINGPVLQRYAIISFAQVLRWNTRPKKHGVPKLQAAR